MSPKEAFAILEAKFAKLKPHDLIELCHKDEKYPAIVADVDHARRNFEVIKIDAHLREALAQGEAPCNGLVREVVKVPSKPSEIHPMWNVVGK